MTSSDPPSDPSVEPSSEPVLRPYPPVREADERTMLIGILDWYRDGVLVKVAGLSDAAARRRRGPSASSIIGIVNHLASDEDGWFTNGFAGLPLPEPWASAPWDDDADWEFNHARQERLATVVERYREACQRSRSAYAEHPLETLRQGDGEPFTLRWALLHMVEETARHLGHLDILRELTDGQRGG